MPVTFLFGLTFKAFMYWIIGILVFIIISLIVIKKRLNKPKPQKLFVEGKKEIEILMPYSYMEQKKPLSLKTLREKWIIRTGTPIGINMELVNGDIIEFIADAGKPDYKYRGKTYIIDENLKYFKSTSRMYFLDYHENFTMPIRRKIPLKEIQKGMTSQKYSEENIFYATNPKTLENFLTSSTIEKILSGAKLDEWLRQIRLMIIIVLFVVVIHLLLFAVKTGMLSSIHL